MQHRILLIVWRQTYGFNRKDAELSLSFLAEAVGVKKQHIAAPLNGLIAMNAIQVTGKSGNSRTLSFNKYFDQWKMPAKPPPKRDQQKPTAPPKKREKLQPKRYDEDNTYYKMAKYFHDKIVEMAANIGFNHASIAKVDLQKWADEFRKIVELDEVQDKALIRDVIDWVTADSFWQTNILSAKKLREKFGELALKMKASGRQHSKPNRQQDQHEQLMREIREEMERDQDGGQEAIRSNQQVLLEFRD